MSIPVWDWSKNSIKAFMAAASRGRGKFHIRAGLDAALLEDLPEILPGMTRLWINMLTEEQVLQALIFCFALVAAFV